MRALLPMPHRRFVEEADGAVKVSIFRPVESLKVLLKRDVSPENLAISGGLGVFLGVFPLIACQALVILVTTNYLRLNKYAALGTSQICNPPILPALCIETGYFVRHGRFLTEISLRTLGYQGLERILEWIIGAFILGPLMGLATAGIMYGAIVLLKRKRPIADG